jgi:hypothetical protein
MPILRRRLRNWKSSSRQNRSRLTTVHCTAGREADMEAEVTAAEAIMAAVGITVEVERATAGVTIADLGEGPIVLVMVGTNVVIVIAGDAVGVITIPREEETSETRIRTDGP